MATLVVFSGLPASGKSTIARELAKRIGAVWLRIDSMDQAIWAAGDAPADLRDWTYRAAQAAAVDNLRLGHDVIGDSVNGWAESRDAWRQAGMNAGADVLEVEVVCTDHLEHRRRVETRLSDVPGLALPDWSEVAGLDYQPWDRPCMLIDSAKSTVAEAVERLVEAVRPPSLHRRLDRAARGLGFRAKPGGD